MISLIKCVRCKKEKSVEQFKRNETGRTDCCKACLDYKNKLVRHDQVVLPDPFGEPRHD